MPDLPEVVRVYVDFNDMDLQGRFFTLPEDADNPLGLHSQVLLHDDEGNTARGQVVETRDRGRAIVEMTAGTWRSAGAANAASPGPSFQDQVTSLLASYLRAPGSFWGGYRQSLAPAGVLATAATPALGLSQPRGAVLSPCE